MENPKHIWIIPDWNRTRAKEKWMSSFIWHMEWFNKVKDIVKHVFKKTNIDVITIWWLSTENLTNRSKKELDYLFNLYKKIPWNLFKVMEKCKVNFKLVWNKWELPWHLVDFMNKQEEELNFPDSNKYLILALNYWWQDEIIRWMKRLKKEKLEISQENLEKCMDFWGLPKLDLVIRTKQKLAKRLSWFMLWRIWYSQLYFTDIYCPELTIDEFNKAIERYKQTKATQNHGK